MKICRFDDDRLGVVVGDEIADVSGLLDNEPAIRPWPLPPGDWLIKNLARLRPEMERLAATAAKKPLADAFLLSPIANPGKIIGAPVNYYAHQDEANADKSIGFGTDVKTIEHYGLFLKANSSLVGAGQGVQLRLPERRHDHEGELVVVIGKTCANIAEADALDYVAGYCPGLDMTARGVEERSLRKSFDSYTVLGPWLTTADEVAGPDDLLIHLQVNGQTRQHCSTSQLIFGVRKLIAYASQFYTLEPGDVIMTGTPAGVGPVLPGDVIHLEIERIGEMHVVVR
jgi:2-keto-4-pentenoate hydratase/2-oxohepta-3-ene-1,7-dioic acid hydratase in catechol pathway